MLCKEAGGQSCDMIVSTSETARNSVPLTCQIANATQQLIIASCGDLYILPACLLHLLVEGDTGSPSLSAVTEMWRGFAVLTLHIRVCPAAAVSSFISMEYGICLHLKLLFKHDPFGLGNVKFC